MNNIDEIWAADLIDMQAFSNDNNGIKYLLTVIDIFSQFVLIVPLKRKIGQEVANAFSGILKARRPSIILVDKGPGCYNKLVAVYSTENEEKSCVIERCDKTIKENMFKYVSANNTRKFVDVLNLLVDQYNNTIHLSIKMTAKIRKMKIKCGEIYIQNLVVRPWHKIFDW